VDDLLRMVENAGLEDDQRVQELLKVVGSDSASDRSREKARMIIQLRVAQSLQQPFEQESMEYCQDSIRIGTTRNGYSLIDQSDLQQHLLVSGASGSGKTTFFYNLMIQAGVPWMAFDLKQDYRHLANRGDVDVLVLPLQRMGLNPLKPPPGMDLDKWVQRFAEVFGDSQGLGIPSTNWLTREARELLEENDCFKDGCRDFPNMVDLLYELRGGGPSYADYSQRFHSTVKDRVGNIVENSEQLWNVEKGMPLRNLLKRNVVIELGGYKEEIQNFVMEYLMAWTYHYRKENGFRDGGLHHLFFLDEGKTLFAKAKQEESVSGTAEIDLLTAKMREFGEGLVVADQEPSKLTDSIKSNTGLKLLMDTRTGFEFDSFADAMNLSGFQRRRARDLGTGRAVVSGDRGVRFVRLNNVGVEKNIADSDLQRLMGSQWSQLCPTEKGVPVKKEANEEEDEESEGVDLSDFN